MTRRLRLGHALWLMMAFLPPSAVVAQEAGLAQVIASAAGSGDQIARFYQERHYAPLWTGPDASERRQIFLDAIATASEHGLPTSRYDAAGLIAQLRAVYTPDDLGRVEMAITRAFLAYAHDLRSGAIVPGRVDPTIVRDVSHREPLAELAAFEADPAGFLRKLPPQDPEYARLMRAARLLRSADWGRAVPASILRPGQSGASVVALRDRLIAMRYLGRTAAATYDTPLREAVARFQTDHALSADGIAGEATLAALNIGPDERLKSVLVALERQRWMNADRGARHIWVNLADFTTQIVDGGEVVFQTRSVIGKEVPDQRTPEFSDVMDHMVINPSWFVPRSIVTQEYLPQLQRNRNAVSHIHVVDANGRVVDRGAVNFGAYTARTFPFSMRQPPSDRNALGLVKFMFPNKWNIYLHDTPSKSLFDRAARAFSHGCVRLADPFDFAYALLSAQEADPEGAFRKILASRKETRVNLAQPVPVHLVYFTAVAPAVGQINYHPDIYGRDAAVWDALDAAGVALREVQG
ncbi:L,D-transpeptidase family protein [Falsirhodobacter xinxiangensis]|uniref:L,D-transpeptidase family protein n=1 Tax=Falsirhodobacter xinxiangensis TaxID=2530049 RepID=UPI0010AA684B|nr:L,D-transpeptidase family protein [Rhodobacter xinxiangensis]